MPQYWGKTHPRQNTPPNLPDKKQDPKRSDCVQVTSLYPRKSDTKPKTYGVFIMFQQLYTYINILHVLLHVCYFIY